jgi:hypothetical protein
MHLREAEVLLSTQRLQELMLWHGKDEGNLPPAATLVNLSRDTIAALWQLRHTRARMTELRASLSELFWSCESSRIRVALLTALGDPPEPDESLAAKPPEVSWAPSVNGLSLPAWANESPGASSARPQRAAG